MMNGGFTTVMKQHFVDYFVGKNLNTEYWATSNSAGSAGTWAMSDFGLCLFFDWMLLELSTHRLRPLGHSPC